MTVEFKYELTGLGWADCDISIGPARLHLSASYLSDALADLLGAVNRVLSDGTESRADFEEEPGLFRWILTPVGSEELRAQVVRYSNQYGPEAFQTSTIVVDEICALRDFASAVLDGVAALEAQIGVARYNEQWHRFEFPVEELRQLATLLGKSWEPSGPQEVRSE